MSISKNQNKTFESLLKSSLNRIENFQNEIDFLENEIYEREQLNINLNSSNKQLNLNIKNLKIENSNLNELIEKSNIKKFEEIEIYENIISDLKLNLESINKELLNSNLNSNSNSHSNSSSSSIDHKELINLQNKCLNFENQLNLLNNQLNDLNFENLNLKNSLILKKQELNKINDEKLLLLKELDDLKIVHDRSINTSLDNQSIYNYEEEEIRSTNHNKDNINININGNEKINGNGKIEGERKFNILRPISRTSTLNSYNHDENNNLSVELKKDFQMDILNFSGIDNEKEISKLSILSPTST